MLETIFRQPTARKPPSALAAYLGASGPNAAWLADPALLQTRAAGVTAGHNADSAALASRQALLAQLGDHGLAETVLGAGDPTLGAVSADPNESTSTLAGLARGYGRTVQADEAALNRNNLFYSSARAGQLNRDAQDYSEQQAHAISQAQAGLGNITTNTAAVKGQAEQADTSALGDAFSRFLQMIAASPPEAMLVKPKPMSAFLSRGAQVQHRSL